MLVQSSDPPHSDPFFITDGSDAEDHASPQAEHVEQEELDGLAEEARVATKADPSSWNGLGRGKRKRLLGHQTVAETTEVQTFQQPTAEADAKAEAAWQAFKDDEKDEKLSRKQLDGEELVRVERTYRFAGETVVEENLLPASHPDAVAYLDREKANEGSDSGAMDGVGAGTDTCVDTKEPVTAPGATSSAATAGASIPKAKFESALKSGARPGPKKRKGSSLAALSAAATAVPVKLNTLEKSKLDWEKFKGGSAGNTALLSKEEREEMEKQTRGGGSGLGDMRGFIDRKDFLERVEKRQQDQFK